MSLVNSVKAQGVKCAKFSALKRDQPPFETLKTVPSPTPGLGLQVNL